MTASRFHQTRRHPGGRSSTRINTGMLLPAYYALTHDEGTRQALCWLSGLKSRASCRFPGFPVGFLAPFTFAKERLRRERCKCALARAPVGGSDGPSYAGRSSSGSGVSRTEEKESYRVCPPFGRFSGPTVTFVSVTPMFRRALLRCQDSFGGIPLPAFCNEGRNLLRRHSCGVAPDFQARGFAPIERFAFNSPQDI